MSQNPLPPFALLATVALSSLMLSSCGQDTGTSADTQPPAQKPVESVAQTTDPSASPSQDWSGLTALVGQYPSQSGLFTTSPIATSLQNLLGDRFETFKTNFQVEAPLQADGETLFTSGNRKAAGGSQQAYILISPKGQQLEVGLWEDGKLTTYKTQGANLTKPADIVTLISNAAH